MWGVANGVSLENSAVPNDSSKLESKLVNLSTFLNGP